MRLFDDYEAIKFKEENLIFITNRSYLYCIYDVKNKRWYKHHNAGYDCLSVENYKDLRKKDIIDAMGGVFPKAKIDFIRLLHPSELYIAELLELLQADYPEYTEDSEIYTHIRILLQHSDIYATAYSKLRILLDTALSSNLGKENLLERINELGLTLFGKDIYKKEIEIIDGHDTSSFWIMPARIIDYSNTDNSDNVFCMTSNEISIGEDDVDQYLSPFFYKHFDANLKANQNRFEYAPNASAKVIKNFEWYLTHNFFSHDCMNKIIKDIKATINALTKGIENEYTKEIKKKRGLTTYKLIYSKNLTDEQIKQYNANRPTENNTEIELIIDFYHRFIYRIEYMMRVGQEKGFDLISIMGP